MFEHGDCTLIEMGLENQRHGRAMSRFGRATTVFVLLMLLYPVLSGVVYAAPAQGIASGTVRVFYIDPGTASLIIQVLVGAVVAGLVSVRVFWKRINASIRSFFSRRRRESEKD